MQLPGSALNKRIKPRGNMTPTSKLQPYKNDNNQLIHIGLDYFESAVDRLSGKIISEKKLNAH